MAKQPPAKEPPATKAPPTPTPSTTTVDLSKWKKVSASKTSAGAEPTEQQREERERRQKVSWQDLAGIPGLKIVDLWDDDDATYGQYFGATIRLPATETDPATEVLALTNAKSAAGRKLASVLERAEYDDAGDMVPISVFGRLRVAKQHADGSPVKPGEKPMVRLSFGQAAVDAGRE